MDVGMLDADHVNQLDQLDHPDELDPPGELDPGEPDQTDEPDDASEADPNDLYEGDIKTYDSITFMEIDATEPEPAYAHEHNESSHKRNCHLIEITIRETTNFGIEKIYLPPGATEADFEQAIDDLLVNKTERDLIIWHYHGSAGGVDTEYKWRLQGGPNINSYDFIEKLCNSRPDSMLLLDCYIQNKWEDKWKLNTGNVEVITLQCKLQDGAGRMIHASDAYLTEGVCRNLRRYLATIRRLSIFKVAKRHPRSIPHILGRDYSIKSTSIRIWFSRTGEEYDVLCLRFMVDPMRIWQTGKIAFDAYCIGPPRPEPDQILPLSEVDEDEGLADMDDAPAEMMELENTQHGSDGTPSDGGSDASGNGSDGNADDEEDENGLFV